MTIKLEHITDNYVYNLFIIKVFNSDNILLSQVYSYSPDAVTMYDVGLGEKGDYYIVVETACENDTGRCEYHRSDEYQLTVNVFSANDYVLETEPNNTIHTADNFFNGGILTGQLLNYSDEDYYVINTSGAADIIVNFYHAEDNYEYNLFYVDILNVNGVILNSTSVYAPDEVTHIGFSVEDSGDYFIKVTGCQRGNRCEIHGTDQYTIQATISLIGEASNTLGNVDSNLDIHIPSAIFGNSNIWVDLEYNGSSGFDHLWKLKDYGVNP